MLKKYQGYTNINYFASLLVKFNFEGQNHHSKFEECQFSLERVINISQYMTLFVVTFYEKYNIYSFLLYTYKFFKLSTYKI